MEWIRSAPLFAVSARTRERDSINTHTNTPCAHPHDPTPRAPPQTKAFITQAYGFQEANIRTLTDEKGSGNELPTRANIIAALQWLAAGA